MNESNMDTNVKTRVLFVDDEKRILDGLRRQLHSFRKQWDMKFALSGAEALAHLEKCPADIVVSDMRMPEMNGCELLSKVHALYPQTIRIILSGQTEQTDLLKDLSSIHQYLQKPCPPDALSRAITRATQLRDRLQQPQLRSAANNITVLPPCSETYRELKHEIVKPEPSLERIGSLLQDDPALASKILQLVNSAFFGIPRAVNDVRQAAVLLGIPTLQSLIVGGRIFGVMAGDANQVKWVNQLWSASASIGQLAGNLAKLNGAGDTTVQQAHLAGMLCLVGRVILLVSEPEAFDDIWHPTQPCNIGKCVAKHEHDAFGADQGEVGAFMLGSWAFADDLVEAVAYQSDPRRSTCRRVDHCMPYLHIARAMRGMRNEATCIEAAPELDETLIADLNLQSLLDSVDQADLTRSAA